MGEKIQQIDERPKKGLSVVSSDFWDAIDWSLRMIAAQRWRYERCDHAKYKALYGPFRGNSMYAYMYLNIRLCASNVKNLLFTIGLWKYVKHITSIEFLALSS